MTRLNPTPKLPKVGPIRWRADGFGIQSIRMDNRVFSLDWRTQPHTIQRGCVKIWYQFPTENRVVDRALTVAKAQKRIETMKRKGFPSITVDASH